MNKEHTEYLYKTYPKLYAHRSLPPTDSLMCFDFECGDGWFWLIDRLSEHIQRYIDANTHLNIPQVTVEQVKEKYGGLRFYYDGGNEYISGLVSQTEWLSEFVCEVCGKHCNESTIHGEMWWRNECKECREKKQTI